MQAPTFMKFKTIPAVALAVLAACGGQKTEPVDAALANDLSLASQAQAYRQQQYVSPQELAAMQAYGQPGMYPNGYIPQPIPAGYAAGPYYAAAPAPQTRVVYRDRPAARSSGGGYSTAGTIYRAPAPRPTYKKNTKRDAAIGAVAGAAIGVATSARSDRLKGGLIGAVAGGVLGAVVGNNVDRQRIPY
jgi:hypothetical protein